MGVWAAVARDTFAGREELKVAEVGLEPTRLAALDFESSASAVPPLGQVVSE
jgi:hypothetical protein